MISFGRQPVKIVDEALINVFLFYEMLLTKIITQCFNFSLEIFQERRPMLPRDFQILLKTSLFITLFIFLQCGGKSDSDQKPIIENLPMHEYKLSWNVNIEADISHYLLYAWHGKDTLSVPFIDSSSAGRYAQYFIKKVTHPSAGTVLRDTIEYIANGDWLQFAIAAVNKSGGVSPIGISNFIKSEIPDSSSTK